MSHTAPPVPDEPTRTIGAVARDAGVNLQTVRYYQRRGLLPIPPKPVVGYRRYPLATVSRIRFIKRAQALGFSLREIRQLLDLADRKCAEVRPLAEARRADIARRLADLEAMAGVLDQVIAACRKGDPEAHCPLLDTLSGPVDQSRQ